MARPKKKNEEMSILQASEGLRKKPRYPRSAGPVHIDLDNEELLAEHERLLDEMDASIAEEVPSSILPLKAPWRYYTLLPWETPSPCQDLLPLQL